MSYVVLARKYRPETFKDVAGQEHITDLLGKAIETGRIAHAYLFCGPRGIGKTSCARIFAKCLNCEKAPTLNPCGKCSACQEIAKSNSFDVLEIDGASNRGIDEIRILRENVKFAPTAGNYKIYIIDEVHMLTTEAFNALLKTLEEPPPHVKFIFATTDPNKVPATIISRCQRFDFKRIPIDTIVERLKEVSGDEKLKIEEEACYAIAKAAQGSLRDGLSILDQLSALSEKGIVSDDVFSMLGLVETSLIFEMVDALGEKNCALALETLETIIDKGKDIKQLSKDLIDHFRNLMVIKVGGKSLGKLVDYPIAIKEMLLKQCELFSLEEILKAIDLFIEAQEATRITEFRRIPMEVAFAKLTYQDESVVAIKKNLDAPRAKAQTQPSQGQASVFKNEKGHLEIAKETQKIHLEEIEEIKEVESKSDDEVNMSGEQEPFSASTLSIDRIKKNWDQFTFAVSREKMSAATFLQEGRPYELTDEELIIAFPPQCSFNKETLEDQSNVKMVQDILLQKFNIKVQVTYVIVDNYSPADEEDHVQDAVETFGGEVVERWHND